MEINSIPQVISIVFLSPKYISTENVSSNDSVLCVKFGKFEFYEANTRRKIIQTI